MQTPGELSHSSSSVAAPGNLPEASHSLRQLIQFTGVNRVLQALLEGHNNLRLRTKLLLWLVLFTAALTSATLLVVRHSAQALVQRQIQQDARNAVLTIQAVQHQREMMLSRRADLLATLAYVRNGRDDDQGCQPKPGAIRRLRPVCARGPKRQDYRPANDYLKAFHC